jgi:membrane-bound lytic murein transglycosylase D
MEHRRRWGKVAFAGVLGVTLVAGGAGCSGSSKPRTSGEAAAAAQPPEASRGAAPAAVAVLPQVDEVPAAVAVDPAEGGAGRLAEALEAYESAEVFWQQGGFEDAFAALDRAYELMASVPMNGDTALNQEKDNLRRLISRRLVEIYASQQTAVGDLDRSIPLVLNDDVRAEIRSFQGRERRFFLDSYERSGLYRPMIVEELRKAGLPEQLSWLPLVESGFKTRAFSSARALGLWQFISSTGYRYDLRRTPWVDQRMDPERSTRAAIGYLTDLHGLFGDWMTALAAYNCGENAVLRVMRRQPVAYFDRFWDLYQQLPRETRRYVPRMLAVLAILDDPEAYGFTDLPQPLPAVAVERVEVARAVKLEVLDRALTLPEGTLEGLNPELRLSSTPAESYRLRVPAGLGGTLVQRIASLPVYEPAAQAIATHRVRPGETLSRVAAQYGADVDEIVKVNRLRSAHRIHPGQQLQVPDHRRNGNGASPAAAAAPAATEARLRVQSGDNLWSLAQRHGTTADRIRRDNGLRSDLLQPGQELVIRPGGAARGYTVRRGDTLGSIARHHGVSLGRLLRENELSTRSTIFPGQTLRIPN